MENYNETNVFAILANPTRRKILQNNGSIVESIKKISHDRNQSTQNIHQHLQILKESGIITKSREGYSLSPLGKLYQTKIFDLLFLIQYKDYINTHRMDDIPQNLVERLGELSNSKIVSGIHIMLSRWTRIINEAEKFFFAIFTEPPLIIADFLLKKTDKNFKICILLGKEKNIHYENEFVRKIMSSHNLYPNIEKRITGKIQTNLIMSEKESCLMFPSNNGESDFHNNIVSVEPEFINWCKDFFEYHWNSGVVFSRLRSTLLG